MRVAVLGAGGVGGMLGALLARADEDVTFIARGENLVEGRRLELAAVNGAVSRMGRELGVATPLNDTVYAALEPYADGAPVLPEPT
jgi:ketopantoate reductase